MCSTFSFAMPTSHRGRLQSVEDPLLDMPATLTFDQKHVQIRSEGHTFGRWPLREFGAERSEANRFSLVIGDELWTFAAEDPADFMVTSLEVLGERARDNRVKELFHRMRSAGMTFGAFSLAVATILTAFAGGVLVGRYRLERNGAVSVAAVVVIVVLSLIRVRASRRLRPPPSVAARALERTPAKVTRLEPKSNQIDPTERTAVTLPGPLAQHTEEPEAKPGLTQVRSTPRDTPPTFPVTVDARSRTPRKETQTSTMEDGEPVTVAAGGRGDQDGPTPEIHPDHTTSRDDIHLDQPTSAAADQDKPTEIQLDLTTIKGIGPAFAERLTDLGVLDVRDLAGLDEEDVMVVVECMGRFGTRVVTEDWVGQARRLLDADSGEHHLVPGTPSMRR